MSLEQGWPDQMPQNGLKTDASGGREPELVSQPHLIQTGSGSLRQRLRRFAIVALFAVRHALIPALLLFATVFAGSTYMRVEKADAKITLAYTKAEYAQALGQPGSIISLVDKKGRLHRISAGRLLEMPHVADLAHQTRSTLAHNSLIALALGGLWLIVSTFRTTRRLL